MEAQSIPGAEYDRGGIADTPAINDATGHCVDCGRDNSDYPDAPCYDDCPSYWEKRGFTNTDYPPQ